MTWCVPETDRTIMRTYHKYAFSGLASITVREAGLYLVFGGVTAMIARSIVSPSIERVYFTEYEDGWDVVFPSNWTRWFIRALTETTLYMDSSLVGSLVKDITGATYVLRQSEPWAGSPNVVIGRDNTPPSPTDTYLRDPIGSLSSQTQAVEIDTVLQECRIVRQGTYTPSTTETLGEVALTTNLYDSTGTARTFMVARAIFDPAVTLEPNVTYTIGIVLKMG